MSTDGIIQSSYQITNPTNTLFLIRYRCVFTVRNIRCIARVLFSFTMDHLHTEVSNSNDRNTIKSRKASNEITFIVSKAAAIITAYEDSEDPGVRCDL